MITYAKYRPTAYDTAGLACEDRQDWFVVCCGRNRDSSLLDESNFATALSILGGESDTVEIHRFGHWACGWFEIILAAPSREEDVRSIESSLADYPVLSDSDLSDRECEAESEAWTSWAHRDFARQLRTEYELSDATYELLLACEGECWDLYQDTTSGTEHSDSEIHFPFRVNMDRYAMADFIRTCRKAVKARKAA